MVSDSLVSPAGAMVNVWVVAPTEQQALERSAQEVQEAGWCIEALDALFVVAREDFSEDSTDLEYFEQALADGIVLVFHTWQDGTRH